MDDLHSSYLLGLLIFLILCSAFFSSSETGMLSLNRYRLKHMAKEGHKGARRVTALLSRPDRLLGTILVGNNVVNILAASIATVLAVDMWGEAGIAIATAGLTIVVLIFGEITPKTLAALRPELVAFPASRVLAMLQRLLYPVVWATSAISNRTAAPAGRRPLATRQRQPLHRRAAQRGARVRRAACRKTGRTCCSAFLTWSA